jgi:hypothetical protein
VGEVAADPGPLVEDLECGLGSACVLVTEDDVVVEVLAKLRTEAGFC